MASHGFAARTRRMSSGAATLHMRLFEMTQIEVRNVLGQFTGTPTIVRGKYCVTCVHEHLDDGNQQLWVIIGNDDAQGL
jgi:hypothetical protein